MTTTIESNIWCELASQWITRNSIEGLDAVQRARFGDHASACERCANFLQQLGAEPSEGAEKVTAEWPHLADDTLRLLVKGGLAQSDQMLVEVSVEPHLQVCDYCADRLAAIEEWPEVHQFREVVVGRAITTPLHWMENNAELGWAMNQTATGLSVWRVSLSLLPGELEAKLSVEGSGVPESWRFSLPLATNEQLLPTLVFTSDSHLVRCACTAQAEAKWLATPILTMPLPAWTQLVSVGEDPATMVSLNDTKRREIAVLVPYEGEPDYEAIAPRLNTLVVDLSGERLMLTAIPSDCKRELAGWVLNRIGRKVGAWTIRFTEDRLMDLIVTPIAGEIIRLAVPTNGAMPHYTQTAELAPTGRILQFDRPRAVAARINKVAAVGLAAGVTFQSPLEDGRRFLVRGRHEFVLGSGERQATVEIEERNAWLWIRFLRGTPVRLIGAAEPLGATMKVIESIEDSSLESILAYSLEWCE